MIHPSVVTGVGTTGANVIANVERILYEVLGEERLEFLKLLIIETDNARQAGDIAGSPTPSRLVDAFEKDLGKAIADLGSFLGPEFDWCPKDLDLGGGKGAGNVRAGGRLMFHSKFPEIHRALSQSIYLGAQQVTLNSSNAALERVLHRRGISHANQAIIDPSRSVVYVVGTLAGGTCSGMCVDLGYSIRQIDQQCERIGIFIVPDRNAPETFRQNAWAAIKDLEFFIDNPEAFRGVWLSEQRTPVPYSRGRAKPYDRIYLVSAVNQAGQTRLSFETSLNAPLTVMVAHMIAADLLGLYAIRAGKLVNLNQHVPGAEKHRTFLNFNLRAISYPKYEIAEAGACTVISQIICSSWLSRSAYRPKTGILTSTLEENEREKGRELWREHFEHAWNGAGASADLTDIRQQIVQHLVDDSGKALKFQFASDAQNTIFSKVAQTRRGRYDQLKSDIVNAFRARIAESRNLRCGELFLEGVLGELQATKRYWEALRVPSATNPTAWTGIVNQGVDDLERDTKSLFHRLMSARTHIINDSLIELRTLLSMHLLTQVLDDLARWISSELMDWLQKQRAALDQLQRLAEARTTSLIRDLGRDQYGPVLRVSRSKSEGFDAEVEQVAKEISEPLDLDILGLLDASPGEASDRAKRMFVKIKDHLQPPLLSALSSKGYVNLADQIREQNHVEQAAMLIKQTLELSLATHPSLQTAPSAVPSYVLARDEKTARDLIAMITQSMPGLQNMELKELPIFDHLAIFYQEGAALEPDYLDGASSYQSAYDRRRSLRADYIDPLEYMKAARGAKSAEISG